MSIALGETSLSFTSQIMYLNQFNPQAGYDPANGRFTIKADVGYGSNYEFNRKKIIYGSGLYKINHPIDLKCYVKQLGLVFP